MAYADTLDLTDPMQQTLYDSDLYNVDLAGQLDGVPGGGITSGTTFASDPSGIGTISTNPIVNPNPTGGYMDALAKVAAAASGAFVAYEKGSPSVATPPPKVPAQGGILGQIFGNTPNNSAPSSPSGNLGPFKVGTVALVAAGVAGLLLLAHFA